MLTHTLNTRDVLLQEDVKKKKICSRKKNKLIQNYILIKDLKASPVSLTLSPSLGLFGVGLKYVPAAHHYK